MTEAHYQTRYFTSYSGIKLPLKLVGEITDGDMNNRNTFYESHFNEQGQLCQCRKIIYGETELVHHYRYHDNGQLKQAIITAKDDVTTLNYSKQGQLIP